MSNQVLALTGTGPAINKYRIFNAASQLYDDYDIFAPAKYIDELTPERAKQLAKESTKSSVDPLGLIMAYLSAEQGPYDVIWTNEFHEQPMIYLQHQQEKHGTKIIADIDDWFEDVPAGNIASPSWQSLRPKRVFREILESADQAIASTPFLAEQYNAALCPNFVVPDEWKDHEISPNRAPGGKWSDDVIIMCAAGAGRGEDYLLLEAALRQALMLENVKVCFVGWVPDWAEEYPVGRKVVFCRWTDLKDYPAMMAWAKPDLFISPMVHNDFNLAKSNLKWLEAGMLGACFVGERWGEYERTVEHGKTGVLCNGPDEWQVVLPELCMDRELREAVARRGAMAVEESWTWPAVKEAWTKGVLGDEHSGKRTLRGPVSEQRPAATG